MAGSLCFLGGPHVSRSVLCMKPLSDGSRICCLLSKLSNADVRAATYLCVTSARALSNQVHANLANCKDHLSTVLLFLFLSAIYSENEKKFVNQPFHQLRSKRSRKLDN